MPLYTSDLHLGHKNIIELCKRPFASVEEMDNALIESWNRKVGKDDLVYLVGDAVWDKKRVAYYMDQLSGKKILVAGNHDAPWIKKEECQRCFEDIISYAELRLEGHPVTICHYPMLEWRDSREESAKNLGYLIHGHIHNRVAEEYRQLFLQFNALNAGADVNGFEPVTFDELVDNNLSFKLKALESEEDRRLLLERYENLT